MKMSRIPALAMFLSFLLLGSCKTQTDVLESGTYRVDVVEVVSSKSGVIVRTFDGKRLELFFNESTELMQNGQIVPFETLKKGQQVDVTVENVEQDLTLIAVVIVD